MAMLFSEEYMWEQNISGPVKLGEMVLSSGENSNELVCSI